MTIQQLTYIIALDSERNFVRAAEKCFVSQPSLTMQVKKLEDELDVQIFDRSKKPLIPTPAGIPIIEQARTVLAEVTHLKSLVSEQKGLLEGELRLGVIPTISPYLLPQVLPKFEAEAPKVQLTVQELQTTDIIRKLRNDELDVGLLATPLNETGITELPLFEEPMLGYVGPNHRLFKRKTIKLSDLLLDDTWLLSQGHCFRSQVLNICANRGMSSNSNFESGSLETLQRMVEQHRGMTILPAMATTSLSKTQQELLRPFSSTIPTREVSLVISRTQIKRKMIDTLHATILAAEPSSVRSNSGNRINPI